MSSPYHTHTHTHIPVRGVLSLLSSSSSLEVQTWCSWVDWTCINFRTTPGRSVVLNTCIIWLWTWQMFIWENSQNFRSKQITLHNSESVKLQIEKKKEKKKSSMLTFWCISWVHYKNVSLSIRVCLRNPWHTRVCASVWFMLSPKKDMMVFENIRD